MAIFGFGQDRNDLSYSSPPWLTLPRRFAHKRADRAPVYGHAFYRHPWPFNHPRSGGRGCRMTSSGGVSRVAKGADCKSAAVWLRRFESFFPHQIENAQEFRFLRVSFSVCNRYVGKTVRIRVSRPCSRPRAVVVRSSRSRTGAGAAGPRRTDIIKRAAAVFAGGAAMGESRSAWRSDRGRDVCGNHQRIFRLIYIIAIESRLNEVFNYI